MTREYLIGELSVRLERSQATAANAPETPPSRNTAGGASYGRLHRQQATYPQI